MREEKYNIAVAMQQHVKCFSVKEQVDSSAPSPDPKEDFSTIHIPPTLDGKHRAYRCPCVPIDNLDYEASLASAEKHDWKLNVDMSNGVCNLYSRGLKIGEITNEDVSGMLSDWIHRGEPYLIYLLEVHEEKPQMLQLFFIWTDAKV